MTTSGRYAPHVCSYTPTLIRIQGAYTIGDPILHIELRRWADIVLVAPCSANTLAKIAAGLCDNLAVRTPFLPCPFRRSRLVVDVIASRAGADDPDVHLSRDEHPHVRAPSNGRAYPCRTRGHQVPRRRANRKRACMRRHWYALHPCPRWHVIHGVHRYRSDDRVERYCQDRRRQDAAPTETINYALHQHIHKRVGIYCIRSHNVGYMCP